MRRPAEMFHPSEFIEEEMAARGWSRRDLAERMGGDVCVNHCALDLYCETRHPEMLLGVNIAEGLAAAFGTSAGLWLNLDKSWREWIHASPDTGASP